MNKKFEPIDSEVTVNGETMQTCDNVELSRNVNKHSEKVRPIHNKRVNKMNQVQHILNSKASIHNMSDRSYKGETPTYRTIVNPKNGLEQIVKTSNGVPFVRL